MFNYIFRKKDLTMEAAWELLTEIRTKFTNLDIWEFEWMEYMLYLSIRCTSDTAHELTDAFHGLTIYDTWDIQYDD